MKPGGGGGEKGISGDEISTDTAGQSKRKRESVEGRKRRQKPPAEVDTDFALRTFLADMSDMIEESQRNMEICDWISCAVTFFFSLYLYNRQLPKLRPSIGPCVI